MSRAGITGMRCAAEDIITVGSGLSENEWQAPSAAAGWTVHDVVIHAGALLEVLQAAVRGDAMPDSTIEALNDVMVAERRNWDTARTLDNLHKQLEQALQVFSGLQEEPMASVLTPMFDLGSHPLHAIADMFTFDMTTHLRYDILAPCGQSLASCRRWTRSASPPRYPGCSTESPPCNPTWRPTSPNR